MVSFIARFLGFRPPARIWRGCKIHASKLDFLIISFIFHLFFIAASQATFAQAPNYIVLENAKRGTTEWQILPKLLATNSEIEGYASLTSVNRGGQISFFVSTAEPSYSIEIFRLGWYGGMGARRMTEPITRAGVRQPVPAPDATTGLIECNWTAPYILTIPNNPADPTDWASGVYMAKLTAGTSGKQGYINFVVRDDARASAYLFQSSVTTFQAYNSWGARSLYAHPERTPPVVQARKVSFNRPYDVVYAASPVLQWEYQMVRFLEREGYDVAYCTDVDTHETSNLLLSHKAFLSVGHDEYWSWQMRTNVEVARDRGVNLGFFSANTCYWQIRFEPSPITGAPDRTVVCYKDKALSDDPLIKDGDPTNDYLVTTRWRDFPVNRPEASLLGVMSPEGVGIAVDTDIVVEDASHWTWAGTGVRSGDHLPGLLGVEVDRMFSSSPAGTTSVAHSPLKTYTGATEYSDMTVYTAASGATVFSTGSIQWSWGLDDYGGPALPRPGMLPVSRLNTAAQQLTRNALARFAGETTPTFAIDITGRVVDANGNGVGGVTIKLNGMLATATLTDSNGEFSFVNLAASGTYTITPSMAGLTFGPASRTFISPGSNLSVYFVTPPQSNAIDSAQFFVAQHYLDFLNREPDPGGLAYWISQITVCGADASCILRRRVGVSAAYFTSDEFQQTGYYIYRFYKASLGRQPQFAEFMFDKGRVVGGASLDAGKKAFADDWTKRADFLQLYPAGMGNTDYVAQLYSRAQLGSHTTEQQQAISDLNRGAKTRAQVLRDMIEIQEYKQREYNAAFVMMQYYGYLRRDYDLDGYNFWLNVLDRDPNNFQGMVCAFITSGEYQLRFGSLITHTNADCGR